MVYIHIYDINLVVGQELCNNYGPTWPTLKTVSQIEKEGGRVKGTKK